MVAGIARAGQAGLIGGVPDAPRSSGLGTRNQQIVSRRIVHNLALHPRWIEECCRRRPTVAGEGNQIWSRRHSRYHEAIMEHHRLDFLSRLSTWGLRALLRHSRAVHAGHRLVHTGHRLEHVIPPSAVMILSAA